MAVQTSADDHRDKAKEHIQKAVKELQKCAESEWGWKDYRERYQDQILQTTTDLIKIKRKL